MVGTNAGISAALSLYDYDQSNFRRNLGTVSSLGAPTNARSTTASLGQQASRPFQTDPGNKTGRIFHWLQTKHGAVLGWVGPTWRNWQRQVYRLRGLIGLEAPAAAGQADRRRRASRDFGVAPGDGSKLPARAWLVPILLRSAESHHSIDRHYGQLFGQAQLVRHPVFLWPGWGSQVAYAKPWAPGKNLTCFLG